jgi:LysR family transcriptional regulator, glycine cleavage system transcriptional activator
MRRSRLPLHALRAFEAAANHRSLLRAAEDLGVTHGAVSHQIKLLESIVKKPLFNRARRPIALTAAGEQLLAVVNESFDRLTRAAVAIESGELEGEITLSCVPGLAANWLVPALGDFLATHNNVSVRIETEYWRHPNVSDRVDLAVVYGSAEHPGKRVILLGHSDFFPVASPALTEKSRGTVTPEEMASYTLLHEYSTETWSRWFATVGYSGLLSRGITFDGAHLSLQAARAGYGVAMGDTPTVNMDLQSGRLIRLSAAAVPAAYPYYLLTAPARLTRPVVKALEDWLIARFAFFHEPLDRAVVNANAPGAQK